MRMKRFTAYARGVYSVAATPQGRALLKAVAASAGTTVAVSAKYAKAVVADYADRKIRSSNAGVWA
jgi:hypothetical protein